MTELYFVSPLVVSFLVGALIIPVLRTSPRSELHYIFAATLAAMAVWGLAIFGMRASGTATAAVTFEQGALVAVSATSILFYHFSLLFTKTKRFEPWLPLPLLLAYCLSLAAMIAVGTGQVVSDMRDEWYGYAPVYGSGYWPYLSLVYVLTILGLANLIVHYRDSTSPLGRARTMYVVLGVGCALLGGIADSLPALVTFYPFGMLGNLLFALFTATAILKHNLLDVRLVIKRGVVYSVVSVVMLGTYVLLAFSFSLAFQRDPFALSWPGLVAVLTAAVLLKPVLDRVQRVADSWYWGDRYDHLRALERLSDDTQDVTDLSGLATALEQAIKRAIGSRDVRLLVPSANGRRFAPTVDAGADISRGPTLDASGPIVRLLKRSAGVVASQDLKRAEPAAFLGREAAELANFAVEMLAPVEHAGQMTGILALASKRSREPYSQEDVSLIRAAVNQVAIALANAALFADVVSQRTRLEHVLQRTIRAQEDERLRLSMELHDSPVQWLTSVIYHVEACLESLRRGKRQRMSQELERVKDLLDTTLAELRHTTAALRPPDLDRVGLAKALAAYADAFERDTGIRCSLQKDIIGGPQLPSHVELTVYRVVQEALSNVRKHSGATGAEIRCETRRGELVTTIEDDGAGFDLDEALIPDNGHLGLASMQERAKLVGGFLDIRSALGEGSRVTLKIPVDVAMTAADETELASAAT